MKSLAVLIFAVFIFSCKSSVPKDVLQPKKMQAVLWDIMQADEMAEYYSVRDSTYHGLSKHADYYQKIFSIHKTTREDFTRSLAYYENHPVVFKTVLDSLKSFGERMQRTDSLKKSKIPIDTTKKIVDSSVKKRHLSFKPR